MKLHLYWLENVVNFMGPSQKILCPEFLCFNQRKFISVTLSWRWKFPLNFWLTADDNYFIAGSIPPPLLSGSCKEDGFADIPTHVHSRLENAYSSTSSDYLYPFSQYLFSLSHTSLSKLHKSGCYINSVYDLDRLTVLSL